jgi:hypothetical protein
MSEFVAWLFGIAVGFLLGALFAQGSGDRVWKKMTVERGLALYCPDDGVWAWNGECK